MNNVKFVGLLSVVSLSFSVGSAAQAGVATEVVEQAGKAIARAVAGEAAETGAKVAAKQALTKATQEAAEAGAKRVASRAANVVDDLVAKGGVGDNVADFAWRNKGVIAGGAAVATMVVNPETTLASGASMFNSTVESTAKHVVGPTVSSLGNSMWGFMLIWLFAGLMACLCWDAMNRNRVGFIAKLMVKACLVVIRRVRNYLTLAIKQDLHSAMGKRNQHGIFSKKKA